MTEIPILFMTKWTQGRDGYAQRTIKALARNLICKDGLQALRWYITANDSPDCVEQIMIEIEHNKLGEIVKTYNMDIPPGQRWNMAIRDIYNHHNFYLRLEDDFALNTNFGIQPYVDVLNAVPEIGMVRLGHLPKYLDLHSEGWNDEIFLICKNSKPYAYSGNVALIHRSLHDVIGLFHETKNPGEIEVEFDGRYCEADNPPFIVWPLKTVNNPKHIWGIWDHVGTEKSYG